MLQLAGPKPVAWAGQPAALTLLSPSANITATLGGQRIEPDIQDFGNGTVTVHVATNASQTTSMQQLDIAAGGETFSVNVTSFPDSPPALPEDPVWLEMFEGAVDWNSTGAWGFDTLADVLAVNGTGGKQRFTRASGRVAHALGPGTLTTPPIPGLVAGTPYELRFSSHFAGTDAAVSVSYGGNATEVHHLNSTRDSEQIRISFTPRGPATFAFTLRQGDHWLLDDVAVVRPLPPTTGPILETIDIISDVQNIPCNAWMHDSVLPGLRRLGPASTLVINGDLVGWDADDAWRSFAEALKPAWSNYGAVLSTAGNHEMFGDSSEETKIQHFLEYTGMGARHAAAQERGAHDIGEIGGRGLWGEHVLASGVPLLWLGSERWWQDPDPEPQYVVLSDAQFAFLARRLEYWRVRNRAVLLFSHHPLPFSVSGTWAPFEARNFGPDEARVRHLLAANPHTILITSHTHYDVAAADQHADHRPLSGHRSTVTTLNTGATINWFANGEGEWESAWAGERSPTALRAEIYADRVRFRALRFWNLSTDATEIQTRDVAFPAQGRLSAQVFYAAAERARASFWGGALAVVAVTAVMYV